MLEADTARGTPLDMDQYTRLFGTVRIPTEVRRAQVSRCVMCLTCYPLSVEGLQDAGAWRVTTYSRPTTWTVL